MDAERSAAIMDITAHKAGNGQKNSMLVVVKPQESSGRGKVWRVAIFINGDRFIRPGFQKRKPAIKLAAMLVQQSLLHGWNVAWQVFEENGNLGNMNLAALGSKMQRGEEKKKKED